MINLLSISIAVAVLLSYAGNPRRGILFYLGAVLFAPNIVFSSFSFRIEFVLPMAMLMVAWSTGRTRVAAAGWWRSPVIKAYGVWWLWLMIATLFVFLEDLRADISWILVYSLFRPILVMAVFQTAFANADHRVAQPAGGTRRVLRLIVVAAIPLTLLSIAQVLDFGPVRDITYLAYSSSTSLVISNQTDLATIGYAWRAVAVFENVSYAATYFVAAAGIGLMMLMFDRKRPQSSDRLLLMLASAAAVVGGFFTMSATFLGGISLIMAVLFTMSCRGNWRRAISWGLAVLALLGLAGYALFNGSSNLAATTKYMVLTKILGGAGLATRYGGSDDSTSSFVALTSALQRPIVGWGIAQPIDVMVNDSLFIFLLHFGGLIGIFLFCIFLRQQFILSRRFIPEIRAISRIWLVTFLFCGLGCITFFIPRYCDCWWGFTGAMAGLACAEKSKFGIAAIQLCRKGNEYPAGNPVDQERSIQTSVGSGPTEAVSSL